VSPYWVKRREEKRRREGGLASLGLTGSAVIDMRARLSYAALLSLCLSCSSSGWIHPVYFVCLFVCLYCLCVALDMFVYFYSMYFAACALLAGWSC